MSDYLNVNNKVVLITGDSYDLEYSIAEELALEDARIVILSADEQKAEELTILIDDEYSTDPMYQWVDLNDEDSVENAIGTIEELYGQFNLIVNTGDRGSNEVLLDCLSTRNIYPLFQISKISDDNNHFDLKDKVVVVTGVSGRIGKAVADLFASEGASLVLFSDNEDKILEYVERYDEDNVDVNYIITNLDNQDSIRESLEEVLDSYDCIDFLVNASGMGENKNVVDALRSLDKTPLF